MAVQRAEVLDSAFARERAVVVSRHLRARGIEGPLLLAAMSAVPREAFVPEHLQEFSYEVSALPIEAGQTISQPYIVGLMAQAAALDPSKRVLEIGTGSGYAAAVLALLARHVYSVERHALLARQAAALLSSLDIRNVSVRTGDGIAGWAEEAPFDAILAAASGHDIPPAWKAQLAIGGRLIMPLGGVDRPQRLLLLKRTSETGFAEEDLGDVMFVPLVAGED
jgi:protein-L-isoaspartate(D-aspartate) O-methyltransferase